MFAPDLVALDTFLDHHRARLARDAHFNHGAYCIEDLRGQAWLLACDLAEALQRPLDLSRPDDSLELIRAINRFFYRQKKEGSKNRSFDAPMGDDDSQRYSDVLGTDEDSDPQELLAAAQAGPLPEPTPLHELVDPYHSECAAWHWLSVRFQHRTRRIAEFLLISTSWCRTRRQRARVRLGLQQQLPHAMHVAEDAAALQPWRKFKLPSRMHGDQSQLRLNLEGTPPQPACGQLWLL